jgi:DeoR/GlpR family transcriptional regulator of sugar metabolism
MLKKERQAFIFQQINIHNKVLSSDLSNQLKVSEDTIRRDLQELSDQGKIIKVHGGALSKSFQFTVVTENIYSLPEKRIIAAKAAALIKDGMFVLLSGGSTIRELIKALPEQLNATFITMSIPTAMELLHHPNAEIIFIGNKLSKSSQLATGADVIEKLSQIKADVCFLGTNSIDAVEGITDLEWDVIETKKAMIQSAQKVISLSISEKLNSVQRLNICKPEAINFLITELDPSNDILKPYIKKGIQVL